MMGHTCWDSLQLSAQDMEDLWSRIDCNGDGEIEFNEFLPFITELLQTKIVDLQSSSFTDRPESSRKLVSSYVSFVD